MEVVRGVGLDFVPDLNLPLGAFELEVVACVRVLVSGICVNEGGSSSFEGGVGAAATVDPRAREGVEEVELTTKELS